MDYQTIKSFYLKYSEIILITIFIILGVWHYSTMNKETFIQVKSGISNKLLSQLKQQHFIQQVIKNEKDKLEKEEAYKQMKQQEELQKKLYLSKQNEKSQLTNLQQIGLDDTIRKTKNKISMSSNPVEQQALQSQLISLQQAYTLKNNSINF